MTSEGFVAPARSGAGRPRDPVVDERVREAALVELAERGRSGFSVLRVARRAGVARNTVYLRWPAVDDLIIDALERATDWKPIESAGSYRVELAALVGRLVEVVGRTSTQAQIRFMFDPAETPEALASYRSRVIEHGFTQGREVFDRALEAGQLRRELDPDLLYKQLLGTILLLWMTNSPDTPSRSSSETIAEQFFLMTTTTDVTVITEGARHDRRPSAERGDG